MGNKINKKKEGENWIAKADHKIQEAEKNYLDNRAELGKEQKKKLQEAKNDYFKYDHASDPTSLNQVEKALGAIAVRIYNTHLPYISEAYVPTYEVPSNFKTANRIMYFEITRWVNDTEEKNIEKLVNVYHVLAKEDCNIALIYERKQEKCIVTLAVINRSTDGTPNKVIEFKKRIVEAIYGNFPGAELKETDSSNKGFGYGIPSCLSDLVKYDEEGNVIDCDAVSVITNLATDKSEDFISQSMEKLLDGIVPKKEEEEYKLILIASPSKDVGFYKNNLYEMYNGLAPYSTWQESFTTNDNTTIGVGSSLGKSVGANVGFQAGAPGNGINGGVNFGANFGKAANYNVTVGNSKGETKTCTNYAVKHALELLEEQVKRMETCSALGMWEFAAYAVSKNASITNNVATMYLALTQGEESYLAQSAINTWSGSKKKEDRATIVESLKRLHHPHFILKEDLNKEEKNIFLFPNEADLFTLISGKELVRSLNFPRKSVAGFPVIEAASFGREIQKFDVINTNEENMSSMPDVDRDEDTLVVGSVVHMFKTEKQKVELDVNSFCSHTFVTGSTGTGKSNAIYQIVDGLLSKGKHVLVIEPAKGEYATAFGNRCKAYGTNPILSDVLKINPFSFPIGEKVKKPIHVLEHIDRLIEILNACWPMYAAMPAVLKDAIEMAYVNRGWDLYSSECYPLQFPTFDDLLVTLPQVMDNSLYSKDTQSDYAGALVTRVKSLTNGINGLVLCSDDELSNKDLFETDVIVDISRVGSSETKAMLMGILIMKLQEYHMSSSGINEDLQHVTVLEEAHNLLRKTSMSQGQDSSNLQGKSVEMITNSIAEMRTYGEGFIIADQAPGLLDEAVIRNTNTKIILRLPEAGDRELVGKSATLSDAQIEELAKLPKGVAAVYQNDWVEAVLCQFERFESQGSDEITKRTILTGNKPKQLYFELLFNVIDNKEISQEEIEKIAKWIDRLAYPSSTKTKLRKILIGEKLTENEMKSMAYNLFDGKRMAKHLRDSIDTKKGIQEVDSRIKAMYNIENEQLVERIRQLILRFVSDHMKNDAFENRYLEYMGRYIKY